MSEYKHRDNSGAAFFNQTKAGDTDRDLRGSAMVGGIEYWVSVWVKQARNGSKFLSFSFRAKSAAPKAASPGLGQLLSARRTETVHQSDRPKPAAQGNGKPFDDLVPF
jgi:hypothetical protein